jgi:molybdopterin-containing oxidoreductase family membrane subunit
MNPKPEREAERQHYVNVSKPGLRPAMGGVVGTEYIEHPVLEPGHTLTSVTDKISNVVLRGRHPIPWYITFFLGFLLLNGLLVSIGHLLLTGIGIWGNNQPVGWAFDIINFVWWIGIGHAGTLISAILLLLKQDWRTSINRFAEAMTLFAVACALLFPLIHTGRPWLAAYWLLPYPNTMDIWPQFRSPLIWDVFAVSTYGTVSALFWYTGLVPDLATLRDRAKSRFLARLFGMLALGWRNSARHWARYETAYLLLAGMSTPLVLSVHTVVSFDFSIGIVPGWHATIFPPYFVAGAIYAGFAMVLTLAIPLRKWYGLEDFITMRHLENMAKVTLVTGLIVFYGYLIEAFFAWYSANQYEKYMIVNRMTGPYAWTYWALIFCNGLVPQTLWSKRLRTSTTWLFIMSLIVSVGMWLERFVIIVTSLHRDFVPGAWDMYYPTFWDFSTFFGTIGLFVTLMFLFVRVLPMISIFEVRTLVPEAKIKLQRDPQADYDVTFGGD